MSTSRTHLVVPALLFVQVLFGINYVTSKMIMNQIPVLVWASIRIVLAAAIMVLVALTLRKNSRPVFKGNYLKSIVVFAIFGVILNQTAFLFGLAHTTATNSSILNSLIPVFTLLFATVLGKEKLTIHKVFGFLFAMSGVLVLRRIENFSLHDSTLFGDALTVFNSLCFSYFLVKSKNFMETQDRVWATAAIFVVGALGVGLVSIPSWVGFEWPSLSLELVLCMTYGILAATVVTYFLNNWTLAHTQSSNVALYIYLQPAIAAFLGWLLLDEVVTFREVAATGLIFVGVLLGLKSR